MEKMCEDRLCCPGLAGHTAADRVGGASQPMSAPLPTGLITATRHLLHTSFGQELAHLVIMRGAEVSHAFAKANFPTKNMVTSLAGSICPIFIQEAVKSYTQTLHLGAQPTFEQLNSLPIPDGYERSQPPHWYRPWIRTSPDQSGRSHLPGEASTANIEEDSEPIVKMAGAAGIDSRGSKSDQV